MTDFSAVANEVFETLRSYDYTVLLYDEVGNRVEDPTEASRMFARPENLMVGLVDEGEDSTIRLFIGKSTTVDSVMGLIQTLRTVATKFNLLFNVKQYGKEISIKDFASGNMLEAIKRDANTLTETIMDRVMSQMRRPTK